MVQILIKQGQVEVETEDLIPDYSESLLVHRGVVEDLNNSIRVLKAFHSLTIYTRWSDGDSSSINYLQWLSGNTLYCDFTL